MPCRTIHGNPADFIYMFMLEENSSGNI